MKAFVLGIDVNRASADPSLYFDKGSYDYLMSKHLDETASRIAEFTANARPNAHFIWGMQTCDNNPKREVREYVNDETMFHRVLPHEGTDKFLVKTQMSPYPEHKAYFDGLKNEGYETGVLMGFYAPECIYWALHDMVFEAKFKMIVPTELIDTREGGNPMAAFEEFITPAYSGQVIFTSAENALHFLKTPEDLRRPPYPTITGQDLNNMYFGMGS